VARLLMILTYIAGGVAIGVGFSYVSNDPKLAMTWVTVLFAVVIGLLSWVRHVLLWQDDAKRLDASSKATYFFQWEVGFANGAFAVAGLLAVVFDWGVSAMAAVCLAYVMYLIQAAALNGRRYFSGESSKASRLWGSFIGNGAMCILVAVISFWALKGAGIGPF
jgi:hypothetical protein